jgi:hypothetical protein
MSKLSDKLKPLAKQIDKERGPLHFMALAKTDVYQRWDLLVSSDKLGPWSLDAMTYVDKLLNESVTIDEKLLISRIVPLPKNNKIVAWVMKNGTPPPHDLNGIHPNDRVDKMIIIWPKKTVLRAVAAR